MTDGNTTITMDQKNLCQLVSAKGFTPKSEKPGKVKVTSECKDNGKAVQRVKSSKKPDASYIADECQQHTSGIVPFRTAIIPSTNTTKTMQLSERPLKPRAVVKTTAVKKTQANVKREPKSAFNRSLQSSKESFHVQPETFDFAASVEKNLQTFSDLDKEFYQIIEEQLKGGVKLSEDKDVNENNMVFDDDEKTRIDKFEAENVDKGDMTDRLEFEAEHEFLDGHISEENNLESIGHDDTDVENPEARQRFLSGSNETFIYEKFIAAEPLKSGLCKDCPVTNEEEGMEVLSERQNTEVAEEDVYEDTKDAAERPGDAVIVQLIDETSSKIASDEGQVPSAQIRGKRQDSVVKHFWQGRSSISMEMPSLPLQVNSQGLMEVKESSNKGEDNVIAQGMNVQSQPLSLSQEQVAQDKDETDFASITSEQALKILDMPTNVSSEDMIHITGHAANIDERPFAVPVNSKMYMSESLPRNNAKKQHSFLLSWDSDKGSKATIALRENVHHFCTMDTVVELPWNLKLASRFTHTPSKYLIMETAEQAKPESSRDTYGLPSSPIGEYHEENITHNTPCSEPAEFRSLSFLDHVTGSPEPREDQRLSELVEKVLKDARQQEESGNSNTEKEEEKKLRSFMKLQHIVDKMFGEDDSHGLYVEGKQVELKDDYTRFYWTPAPPKLDLPPDVVEATLFPEYRGADIAVDAVASSFAPGTLHESDEESQNEEEAALVESIQFRERLLRRRHCSASELHPNIPESPPKSNQDVVDGMKQGPDDEDINPKPGRTVAEVRRQYASLKDRGVHQTPNEDLVTRPGAVIPEMKKRCLSLGNIHLQSSQDVVFASDYDTSVRELEYHSEKLNEIRTEIMRKQLEEDAQATDDILESNCENMKEIKEPGLIEGSVTLSAVTKSTMQDLFTWTDDDSSFRAPSSTLRRMSGGTRRRSTVPRKPGKKLVLKRKFPKPKFRDPERERQIQEFLNEPSRIITRSESLAALNDSAIKAPTRSRSLPFLLDISQLLNENYNGDEFSMSGWLKEEFWYKWFDELYPPSTVGDPIEKSASNFSDETSVIGDDIWNQVESIDGPQDEESNDLRQTIIQELERLSQLIDTQPNSAFHLCRRGACYRKLGEIKKSKEDLDRAIEIEPMLIDAYWQRHLLYLLQDNTRKAISELNFIVTKTQTHTKAYRSLADIYRKKGDLSAAIVHLSQAIKLEPTNVDLFYQRASLFDERGDFLLSLDDYKMAHNLMPTRTEAIYKIGMYHFGNRMWNASIHDFTEFLNVDPYNAEIYTYRGRAYAMLSQFINALKDLSMAIELDPNNVLAFYHRGCILRKSYPSRALQDLSVALILDDTISNIKSYLHRGILYYELKRWQESMADFERALRLDRKNREAHVNLGVIYLQVLDNATVAIRRFNSAIRVDPTYVRAYICRAEAHEKLNQITFARKDYTRAIHLKPDVIDYKMSWGKLLLRQGKLDLASCVIKQCAAMGRGYMSSTTQQAAVQTFLKNYKEASSILEVAIKSKKDPSLYVLLGKTRMKAKNYKDAVFEFERAMEVMKNEYSGDLPKAAAKIYFLVGLCQLETFQPGNAIESFSAALRIDSEYAEAYYHRGLAKMKLRNNKAITDFNKALAHNSRFFQAYLSRAAFYGLRGRHAKGIMNCNEAILLEPRSVKAFLYRGALKYHIKAFSLAVKDLTKAISLDPYCELAYFNRAVCYQKMRHFQRALKDYGVVMMLEKRENIKVLTNRGLLYLEIGDIHNALVDFYAAAEIETKNPKLFYTLGICYQRFGMLAESLQSYSRALDIDPSFVEGYIGRGNVYADAATDEGHRLARRDFIRALHMNPKCLLARINLAYSLQIRGKFKAAWVQFTHAINIDEKYRPAYEGRAIVNLQMSDFFAAFMDISAALKIEKSAELLTNRGVINQFMGDRVNAMRDFQAALGMDPAYPLAYYNAANIYFLHRQFKQAFEYYSKAIGWNPVDESAIHNRAITRVMLHDVKGAFQDFARAVELSPETAHTYFNRANVYASQGRYSEAEADYTKALSLLGSDPLLYKRRAEVRGKISKRKEAIEDYKIAITIQMHRSRKVK